MFVSHAEHKWNHQKASGGYCSFTHMVVIISSKVESMITQNTASTKIKL
jgi:hypothetical protein